MGTEILIPFPYATFKELYTSYAIFANIMKHRNCNI